MTSITKGQREEYFHEARNKVIHPRSIIKYPVTRCKPDLLQETLHAWSWAWEPMFQLYIKGEIVITFKSNDRWKTL